MSKEQINLLKQKLKEYGLETDEQIQEAIRTACLNIGFFVSPRGEV